MFEAMCHNPAMSALEVSNVSDSSVARLNKTLLGLARRMMRGDACKKDKGKETYKAATNIEV